MLKAAKESLNLLKTEVDDTMKLALLETKFLLKRGTICTGLAYDLKTKHVNIVNAMYSQLRQSISVNLKIALESSAAEQSHKDTISTSTIALCIQGDTDEFALETLKSVKKEYKEIKNIILKMEKHSDICQTMLRNGKMYKPPNSMYSLDNFSGQPLASDAALHDYSEQLRSVIEKLHKQAVEKKNLIQEILTKVNANNDAIILLVH